MMVTKRAKWKARVNDTLYFICIFKLLKNLLTEFIILDASQEVLFASESKIWNNIFFHKRNDFDVIGNLLKLLLTSATANYTVFINFLQFLSQIVFHANSISLKSYINSLFWSNSPMDFRNK